MNEKKSETSSKYVDKSLFGEQWQIRKVGYITMDNWSLIFWFPSPQQIHPFVNWQFDAWGAAMYHLTHITRNKSFGRSGERYYNVINTSTEKTSYAHWVFQILSVRNHGSVLFGVNKTDFYKTCSISKILRRLFMIFNTCPVYFELLNTSTCF